MKTSRIPTDVVQSEEKGEQDRDKVRNLVHVHCLLGKLSSIFRLTGLLIIMSILTLSSLNTLSQYIFSFSLVLGL